MIALEATETTVVVVDGWTMPSSTSSNTVSDPKLDIPTPEETKLVRVRKEPTESPPSKMLPKEIVPDLKILLERDPFLLLLMLATGNSMVVVFSAIVELDLTTELLSLVSMMVLGSSETLGVMDGEKKDTSNLLKVILVVSVWLLPLPSLEDYKSNIIHKI